MSLPEKVAIPSALVDKCFIEYSQDAPPSLYGAPVVVVDQCPTPAIRLAPGLLSRAVATISQAFASLSNSSLVDDNGLDRHRDALPVTAICSPHVNSLVAVDAAVRHIAHHVEADLLILDPADLAAGSRGVFGGALTAAFWQLYRYHYLKSNRSDEELGLDTLFDQTVPLDVPVCDQTDKVEESFIRARALVRKFLLLGFGVDTEAESLPPRRRILYLRDYGALCKAVLPLLPILYDAASSSGSPTLIVAGISPIQRVKGDGTTKFLRSLEGDDFIRYLSKRSLEEIFTTMFVNRYQGKGIASRSESSIRPRDRQRMRLRFTRVVRVGLSHDPPRAVQDISQSERHKRFLLANLWYIHRNVALQKKSLEFDIDHCREPYQGSNSKGLSALESSVLDQRMLKQVASALPSSAKFMDVLSAYSEAERLDSEWDNILQFAKSGRSTESQQTVNQDPIVARVRNMSLDGHERELLGCIIDPASIQTTFADVCVKTEVVDTLRTAVLCRLLFPEAFKTGILAQESMGGVLLFGPPGTGKTMACRALAKECGARMLKLQASTIQRCHVGDTEQLISAAFRLARRLGPCIMFIDELDALFCKRDGKSTEWHRTMVTEFTQEMDGLSSADENQKAGLIVVGASNRPQDIDSAVVRRLSRRILVDLPSLQQRKNIITQYLKGETYDDTVNIGNLATRTPLFSGSDLRYLVHSAALAALQDIMPASWYLKSGADGVLAPETSRTPLAPRVIQGRHFDQALKQVSASSATNRKELDELRRWENELFQSDYCS